MRSMLTRLAGLLLLILGGCRAVQPAPVAPSLAVVSLPGARVQEEAGWTIVHLSGTPDEVGYQHGYLLAERIDDAMKVVKFELAHDSAAGEDWAFLRDASVRVCWPKVPQEYREEIEGIARGLAARGYDYDWRDVLTLNAHIEMTGYWLPAHKEQVSGIPEPSRAPEACSAFVATGTATADGGVVMGHNFWWGYLSGQRWNVILDISPTSGHRVLMDSLPGFIHSGTDIAINGAGIMICETTISGFKGFDEHGVPEFVRMRRAAQYAGNLEQFASIMREGNNGGYANAWLVGDANTGEIGKLELGLKAVAWTTTGDGYYYGANYPEDPKVKELDCPDYGAAREPRRERWEQVLSANRGRIDAQLAKQFLGDVKDVTTGKVGACGRTLCGRSDLDPSRGYNAGGAVSSRVATSALTRDMLLWARWGFADGSSFDASAYLSGRGSRNAWQRPMLRDIPSEPWVVVPGSAPAGVAGGAATGVPDGAAR